MPNGFEHEINFLEFHPMFVYKWAVDREMISDIENPSFYTSIVKHLAKFTKKELID
jgi:hypothetical protein